MCSRARAVNWAAIVTFAALCGASLPAQDLRERLLADANAAYRSLRAAEAVRLYREYLARYSEDAWPSPALSALRAAVKGNDSDKARPSADRAQAS